MLGSQKLEIGLGLEETLKQALCGFYSYKLRLSLEEIGSCSKAVSGFKPLDTKGHYS